MLLENNSRITVMEGAKNNLPDTDAQRSAECIREVASGLTEKDLLLVLISGTVAYFQNRISFPLATCTAIQMFGMLYCF